VSYSEMWLQWQGMVEKNGGTTFHDNCLYSSIRVPKIAVISVYSVYSVILAGNSRSGDTRIQL
jgi:hypothetical protein